MAAAPETFESKICHTNRYQVGPGGWTKIVFAATKAPKVKDLKTWITESFLLLAPKKVAAQL